jgi:hypothetical protein
MHQKSVEFHDAAEKPSKGGPCLIEPSLFSGHTVGEQTSRNSRASLDGLLIESGLLAAAS